MSDAHPKLPNREEIETLARLKYLQGGSGDGDELADWLTAESERAAENNAPQLVQANDATEQTSSSDRPRNCESSVMVLDFFGLREQPFGVTPDPAYLYASETHREALVSLSTGIADTRGFLALIAEPGMGKTTLLYQLLEQLRETARTVLVSQSQCTSREFIEFVLQDLGMDAGGTGLVAMQGKLNEILFEQLMNGKRFVLVVDEAQNLDDSVLETVRMLSNFETHNAKLIQIVLAGQPSLAEKLAQPRLAQLRQRVSILCTLHPFSVDETRLYISHRLKVAGFTGELIFDAPCTRLITRHSEGIPRNINNLCYNALHLAYDRGAPTITPDIMHEVIARLDVASLAFRPVAIVEAPSVPAVRTAAAKPPATPHLPVTPPTATVGTTPAPKDRSLPLALTYDAGTKVSLPKWRMRSALLAAILVSGTLLASILGRTESWHRSAITSFEPSTDSLAPALPGKSPDVITATYDATPQDTGDGQVITVAAGPQQSLSELCLRYAGRFDSDLSTQVRELNPDLKDPDHLEPGQLIRIPLPAGAMRKANDTQDPPSSSGTRNSDSVFNRLKNFLLDRK
jgi:general secretion pathway protein A